MKYIITEEQNSRFISNIEKLVNEEFANKKGICEIKLYPSEPDDALGHLFGVMIYIDSDFYDSFDGHRMIYRLSRRNEVSNFLTSWLNFDKYDFAIDTDVKEC